MTYKLTLPWPPSVNTYWRHVVIKGSARTLISQRGRDYREEVVESISASLWRDLIGQLDRRLAAHIDAFPPDLRKRDLDNLPKAVLDALKHAGIYQDDSQIDDLRIVRREVDRENPRVEVRLEVIA